LNYNHSLAKEKINRIKGKNQELEARLYTIVNSVGINPDEDVREIQIKLNNLSDKIESSQERRELAQIASVEIEKIDAKIENELFTQAQLKLNSMISIEH
jgi:hypothetical protein